MDFEITRIKNFDDYVDKISDAFDNGRKYQSENTKKYDDLEKIFSELLESNNSEREEKILNFMIETNVAEFATHEYAVLKINQDLCEKSNLEKYKILKTFQNRLHKLEYKPNYQHLQILNLDNMYFAPLYTLEKYVDNELSKYDSSKFDIEPTPISAEKIKTTLSVKKLSLLFRMLSDEELIEYDSVPELSNQIGSAFSSKRKIDGISSDSIKNHFDTPKHDAIKFWEDKLDEMQKRLKIYKNKYD